jgi:HK97 family phage major capsid protein
MTIKELREQRANLAEQARKLINNAENEKRELSAEDNATFDKLHADVDKLANEIAKRERQETLEAQLASVTNTIGREPKPVIETATKSAAQIDLENWRSYLRFGETRALSYTGNQGGYAAPATPTAEFVKVLRDFTPIRQAPCRILSTQGGNDIPFPTLNDTSNSGASTAVNSQLASNVDPVFGQITLKAWNYDSNIVLVPIQLIEDSVIPIETLLNEMLAERIAAITNAAYTTGVGSTTEPQGIVVGASDSSVTFPDDNLGEVSTDKNNAGAVIGKFVDLIHSVGSVYRNRPSFGLMMNDSTLAQLKKLVDTTGRPVWMPSLANGAPDTILGVKVYVNNDMAAIGASAKSVLAGDFSQFLIRDVNELHVLRLNERYADYRQVGFMAWVRTDSKVLNSAAIKYAAHAGS